MCCGCLNCFHSSQRLHRWSKTELKIKGTPNRVYILSMKVKKGFLQSIENPIPFMGCTTHLWDKENKQSQLYSPIKKQKQKQSQLYSSHSLHDMNNTPIWIYIHPWGHGMKIKPSKIELAHPRKGSSMLKA